MDRWEAERDGTSKEWLVVRGVTRALIAECLTRKQAERIAIAHNGAEN